MRRKAEQLGIRFVGVACTSPQDNATGAQTLCAHGVGEIMQIPSIILGGGFPALVKLRYTAEMRVSKGVVAARD